VLLTSYGVSGSFKTSYYRFTIRSFVDGESSGQDIVCGRNTSNIEKEFVQAGEKSGNIAKMAVGGIQGKPGKYDLIMSPTVAGNIFGHITDGAHPLLMMIGMSPLKNDHIGNKIASEQLSIVDNAVLGEGLGSRPFDIEGTPTGKTPIISEGVLTGILHNTSTGKMNQTKSTGNSGFYDLGIGTKFLAPIPSNTVYEGGEYTLEEIITDSRKPTLYVTSNWYTRFTNMMEGSFSTIPRDGMFLIENGEIKQPLRNLRLSDNLLGMCERISAIGKDVQQIRWWEVPTP
jgi:PmbA protein